MIAGACALLALAAALYVFGPQRSAVRQGGKPRLEYLRERRAAVEDNLGDLRFERDAGKYRDEEYTREQAALEREAEAVSAEMRALEGRRGRG